MSGELIALTNSKGGVGKSTMAVHLALWLKEHGSSVALVDADVQSSSSKWLSEMDCDIPVRALHTPDEILEETAELRERYDYIVADGPAGLTEQTRALLLVADRAIIPVGPSALDLLAADRAVRVVRQAQSIREGKPEATLVLNRVQPRTRLAKEAFEALEQFGVPVASQSIHLRTAIADSSGQATVVWHMGSSARAAAREISSVFGEVIGNGQADAEGNPERERAAVFERGAAGGGGSERGTQHVAPASNGTGRV